MKRLVQVGLAAAVLALGACPPQIKAEPIDFSGVPGYEDVKGAVLFIQGDGLHTPNSTTVTTRDKDGRIQVLSTTGAEPVAQKAMDTVNFGVGLTYQLNPSKTIVGGANNCGAGAQATVNC